MKHKVTFFEVVLFLEIMVGVADCWNYEPGDLYAVGGWLIAFITYQCMKDKETKDEPTD